MFKQETIRKYLAAVRMLVEIYTARLMEGKQLKVSITKGNSKVPAWNVSTAPILTCANCGGCMWYCYDVRDALRYGNVLDARARNTAIMRYDRAEYFRQIESIMTPRRRNKAFRWHVGGDIPDAAYFAEMIEIARRHPDWLYWTYTKRYNVVNEYLNTHGTDSLPENFRIMMSEWRGMTMQNSFSLPEFRVIFKGEKAPNGVWICPGACAVCLEANRGCVAGETTYCHEH